MASKETESLPIGYRSLAKLYKTLDIYFGEQGQVEIIPELPVPATDLLRPQKPHSRVPDITELDDAELKELAAGAETSLDEERQVQIFNTGLDEFLVDLPSDFSE
jgi:hypothetical protein